MDKVEECFTPVLQKACPQNIKAVFSRWYAMTFRMHFKGLKLSGREHK